MLEPESKNPWELVAKVGGFGAATLLIRELIRRVWPVKEAVLDDHAAFRDKLMERVAKLEADQDTQRDSYEDRLTVQRGVYEDRLTKHRAEVHRWRNQSFVYMGEAIKRGYVPPEGPL